MKGLFIIAAFVSIALLLTFFSVPNDADIRNEATKQIKDAYSQRLLSLGEKLQRGELYELPDEQAMINSLHIENRIFYKIASFSFDDSTKVLGYAYFGRYKPKH